MVIVVKVLMIWVTVGGVREGRRVEVGCRGVVGMCAIEPMVGRRAVIAQVREARREVKRGIVSWRRVGGGMARRVVGLNHCWSCDDGWAER